MARNKGLTSFSANFEPQVAGPLDARLVVDSKSDLTTTSIWQAHDGNVYTYVGMMVLVKNDPTPSNNGLYYLKDNDYTQENNWIKVSGVSSGDTIWNKEDERVYLTTNTNLVGIGTNNPQAKLHVAYDGANLVNLRISGATARLELENTAAPEDQQCIDITSYETDAGNDWAWWFRTLSDGFGSATAVFLRVDPNSLTVNPDRGWDLGRSDFTFKVHGKTQENAFVVNGDTGIIGVHTLPSVDNAVVDIASTNKGILIPRMTRTQRLALSPTTNSLLVYDISEQQYYYWIESRWYNLLPADYIYVYCSSEIDKGVVVTAIAPIEILTDIPSIRQVNSVIDTPIGITINNVNFPGYGFIQTRGIIPATNSLLDLIYTQSVSPGAKIYLNSNGTLTFRNQISQEVGIYLGEVGGQYLIYINFKNVKPLQFEKEQIFTVTYNNQLQTINYYVLTQKYAGAYRPFLESSDHISMFWFEILFHDTSSPREKSVFIKRFNSIDGAIDYFSSVQSYQVTISCYLYRVPNSKLHYYKFNTAMSQVKSKILDEYSRFRGSFYAIDENGGNNPLLENIKAYIYQTFCEKENLPPDAGKAIVMQYNPRRMYFRNPEMLKYTNVMIQTGASKGFYRKSTNSIVKGDTPRRMYLVDYRFIGTELSPSMTIRTEQDYLRWNKDMDMYSRMIVYCYVDDINNPDLYYFVLKGIDRDQILLRSLSTWFGQGRIYAHIHNRNTKGRIVYIGEYNSNAEELQFNRIMRITKPQLIEMTRNITRNKSRENNCKISFFVFDPVTGLCSESVITSEVKTRYQGVLNCIL